MYTLTQQITIQFTKTTALKCIMELNQHRTGNLFQNINITSSADVMYSKCHFSHFWASYLHVLVKMMMDQSSCLSVNIWIRWTR